MKTSDILKKENLGLAQAISTTLYSGFFPIAPGTVGAAVACFLLWVLPESPPLFLLLLTLVFFFVGVWAAGRAEQIWQEKDPGRINWDEFVGMMTSVLFLPKSWMLLLVAFFVFRIFDVVKPYPVNRAEKIKSGWGIMLDDIYAGIYTNILMQIIFRWSGLL